MAVRRPFVGGNWKMNLDRNGAVALARSVADHARELDDIDVAIIPAFVHLDAAHATLGLAKSKAILGAQDFFPEPNGAYTGEISIEMLKDFGVSAVLVGHSERRHVIGESERLLRRKTMAALEAELTCILCIGETLEQREEGETDAVNESQLRSALPDLTLSDPDRLIIAYEPVWAIGTGRTATPEDAQRAHAHVRQTLATIFDTTTASRIRIIYGGSVKPSNAAELFAQADIDGGLIGGASLNADDFHAICTAARPGVVGTDRLEGVAQR